MKYVYTVRLKTESGDEFSWVYSRKVTEDEIIKAFLKDNPDEEDWIAYVKIEKEKVL